MTLSLKQLALVLCLLPTYLFSQVPAMHTKLQLMPDGLTYGVYVKPGDGYVSAPFNLTATSQVTVVVPDGFQWGNLTNYAGSWVAEATVGAVPANHPVENPDYTYQSFYMQVDVPQINYIAGEETLLFSFKRIGACPDTIYLMDNATDPFNQLPNSYGNNPGNEFSIFYPGASETYGWAGVYAHSAWSCHDDDGDQFNNAYEDKNGNGNFDIGDRSNRYDPASPAMEKVIQLKLALSPDGSQWTVLAKPIQGFAPVANSITQKGRITILASIGFELEGFASQGGQWALTQTQTIGNFQYMTFELVGPATGIGYAANQEAPLFSFERVGECPDLLRILENNIPAGILPNELSGQFLGNPTITGFQYQGVYDRKAWLCTPGGPIGGVIVVGTDSLRVPGTNSLALQAPPTGGQGSADSAGDPFTLSPNPAGSEVSVSVHVEGEGSLRLLDLQGKELLRLPFNGQGQLRLNLDAIPAGLYMVALEKGGRVVQRKKMMKY